MLKLSWLTTYFSLSCPRFLFLSMLSFFHVSVSLSHVRGSLPCAHRLSDGSQSPSWVPKKEAKSKILFGKMKKSIIFHRWFFFLDVHRHLQNWMRRSMIEGKRPCIQFQLPSSVLPSHNSKTMGPTLDGAYHKVIREPPCQIWSHQILGSWKSQLNLTTTIKVCSIKLDPTCNLINSVYVPIPDRLKHYNDGPHSN